MGFGAVVGAGASLAGSIFGASTAAKQLNVIVVGKPSCLTIAEPC